MREHIMFEKLQTLKNRVNELSEEQKELKEEIENLKNRTFEVLDLCCGANPIGTVNADLFVGYTEHRLYPLIPANTPNFVKCDAQHLPFNDNSFETVFSKYGLEHVGQKPQVTNTGPFYMLKEMVRVSKRTVDVRVPHRFSLANSERKFWLKRHNAFFNLKWFERVIPKIERRLNVKLSVLADVVYKPILIWFVKMPDEIRVTLIKRTIRKNQNVSKL